MTLDETQPGFRLVAVPLKPLRAESFGIALPGAARLGLVMTQAPGPAASDASVLVELFGLTPAEADLVQALAADERLAAYAERRGRSLNTVKTHLKAVFAKTGTTRQAELVRLASGLSALRLDAGHGRNRAERT